ncbi:MAG: transglycosylase domain-containing protein [Candidatus Peribacteria bacterium]|nr:MAG: transglycosylase domain-containing protein [Candidatus Peribacteria bacterium]
MWFALQMNLQYSKADILLAYLNNLPYPYATVGIKSACHLYFGK